MQESNDEMNNYKKKPGGNREQGGRIYSEWSLI